jgi:hypothetical protein
LTVTASARPVPHVAVTLALVGAARTSVDAVTWPEALLLNAAWAMAGALTSSIAIPVTQTARQARDTFFVSAG